jgi:glycosyltransferase involved in cell wall biosynthesis
VSSHPVLSIVLPTFNEEAAIADTVRAILALSLPPFEVIVVDDGSSDRTAERAREAGARVISHPYNIGNGAAVKTGIRSAQGDVVCFLDGDGQHDPHDIPRLLSYIDRYHMVVGARQCGSETHIHRDLANFVYNKFASLLCSFKIEDLTSGFRAMRRIDALRFCDMFPNRFSYPTTSTLAFLRSGRSVQYVPIKTRYRIGTSKIRIFRDGAIFFMIILKIAMSFSPYRVFLPVSALLALSGLSWYVYTYVAFGRFTNMSHLLINSSVIVFMLGLIAEQIASMRLERGDKLFEPEDADIYKTFRDYSNQQ